MHAIKGSPAPVISELAESIKTDRIIIETVGRSGIRGRVVGNTAEKALDHTGVDVLVINRIDLPQRQRLSRPGLSALLTGSALTLTREESGFFFH